MPPVSKVTPLPTSATFLARLAFLANRDPRWINRTRRGGRDDPCPTPTTPPYPAFFSAFSSSTSTSRPTDSPSAFARLANSAGKRWLGGVLTKWRGVATAVATAAPWVLCFLASLASWDVDRTVILRSPASLGAVLAL